MRMPSIASQRAQVMEKLLATCAELGALADRQAAASASEPRHALIHCNLAAILRERHPGRCLVELAAKWLLNDVVSARLDLQSCH